MIAALHGFLGLPSDWSPLLGSNLGSEFPAVSLDWMPILADLPSRDPERYLPTLGHKLNSMTEGCDTLLGYSMGGRIALSMLADSPAQWKRAVIISASPGLPIETPSQVREARWANDQKWAEAFVRDPWEEVVDRWNAQPVFGEDDRQNLPPRLETNFNRERLAAALTRGSVVYQPDWRSMLRTIQIPILWVAGVGDAKYAELSAECAQLNPRFSLALLERSGHRAPWAAPEAFTSALRHFLKSS